MKHVQCVNYINLDCEKGMCALSKQIVPIDGEGSGACPNFKAAPVCGNCACFSGGDDHGTVSYTHLDVYKRQAYLDSLEHN